MNKKVYWLDRLKNPWNRFDILYSHLHINARYYAEKIHRRGENRDVQIPETLAAISGASLMLSHHLVNHPYLSDIIDQKYEQYRAVLLT